MSGTLTDVTAVMGEFMLKGWVLTDKTCSNPTCSVPLMRSPRDQSPEVYFCAKCHGHPSAVNSPTKTEPAQLSQFVSNETNISSGSSLAPSTAITEVSNHAEFEDYDDDDDFELPPETEETQRRREQSDRASTEIGSRLLRGWTMLGDECPNGACFGIPLVRPPAQGGEKSLQKECVVCGNVYLPDGSLAKQESVTPQNAPQFIQINNDNHAAGSNSKGRDLPVLQQVPRSLGTLQPSEALLPYNLSTPSAVAQRSSSPLSLDATGEALQHTLRALSTRLTSLTNSSHLDTRALGDTADAISKVVQALGQVRALQ